MILSLETPDSSDAVDVIPFTQLNPKLNLKHDNIRRLCGTTALLPQPHCLLTTTSSAPSSNIFSQRGPWNTTGSRTVSQKPMAASRDVVIDTDPPPAVKSLRSKFENLALDGMTARPPSVQNHLDPNHPRSRAVSGADTAQASDSQHLRSSSSSSDLKVSAKRPPPPPPPPPPPRGSKAGPPSPLPSPLLRPVPIPSILASTSNGHPSDSFTSSSVTESQIKSSAVSGGISSLRAKFS
jgi:hypothetical protein